MEKWKTLQPTTSDISDVSFLVKEYKDKKTSNIRIKYPQEYVNLINITSFLPNNASTTNRLWHIEHNVLETIKCEKCKINDVKWYPSKGGYGEYCSVKCSSNSNDTKNKIKETNLKKYGETSYTKTKKHKKFLKSDEFKNIMNSREVINKRKKTNLDRYGVEEIFQSNEIQEKIKETNETRYGVDNPIKSDEIKDKIKRTNLEKYGTETPFQNSEIRDKAKETLYSEYGVEYGLQAKEILDKTKQKYYERTGYSTPFNNPIVKEKIKEIFKKKYGVHPTLKQFSDRTIQRINDAEWLKEKHHTEQKTLTEISLKYLEGYDISSLSNRMKQFGIEINSKLVSFAEKQLREYIISLGIDIVTNDRKTISPMELDIYIPSYNIAIEYCGIYWHSELYKDKKYHKNKYEKCKTQGIRLITIFENEWIYKKDIVKNKIKHILGKTITKIFARKCKIREPRKKDVIEFINNNHIQGFKASTNYISLYYDNKMVSCMCLTKIKEGLYNIDRFASNTTVIGGFSKLLKYFIKNNFDKIDKIETFSDNRWDNGNVYLINGFKHDKELAEDYSYVVKDKTYHKSNYRKKNLKNKLHYYDSNLTEHQNCFNNKIYRIYDCGKVKFTLDIKKEE
jgi:hypothetical protein